MSRPHAAAWGSPRPTVGPGAGLGRGVEWEFTRVTYPRDFSRNVVTKLLVERAEHGGWELDRLRIRHDGSREVVLRRKIIRQLRRTA